MAAISPIVAGRALKGPADRMMQQMNLEPSARQVAELYRDFVDVFVMDEADRPCVPAIEALGIRAMVTDTIMRGRPEKVALAKATLGALSEC